MYRPVLGGIPHLVGRKVGDADVADLPGVTMFDELCNGVLDGPLRLRAVYLVQVDVVGAQQSQALGKGSFYVLGGVVGAGDLRRQKHLVTPSLDGLTYLGLTVEIALRRVEECQPGIQRSPEGGDGLIVLDCTERAAQGPRPEADDRHFRPVFTELARPHSNERSVFIVASRRGEFVRSRQPAIRLTIMESLPFDGKRTGQLS